MNNFTGETISFRLVQPSDAEFILKLRLDSAYNKYLSPTDNDLTKQYKWIQNYKIREKKGNEFYYIINRKDNALPIGTLRLYDFDFRKNSFCWGSWILNSDKTKYAALECCLFVYDKAFYELGFSHCHMNIKKGNTKVVNFHKRMGVVIVDEDDEDYYGSYTVKSYEQYREHLLSTISKTLVNV